MARCHGCEPGVRTIGSCPIHGWQPRQHDSDCGCQWCQHGYNGVADTLPGVDMDALARRSALDDDAASLGVDPNGEPPMPFHTAIPMDGGDVRDADKIVPGFYRHYDAISVQSAYGTASIVLRADELDRQQIAWDVARECPVTAQVVFRLVDGQVVAQLVSYVAFA